MAAGFADACWDESNASDSDTPSDEENQVLLFFIRMLNFTTRFTRFQFCQCKSTCQRAQRCPCKAKGRHCTPRCKCKLKMGPCKNRPERPETITSPEALLQANKERVKVVITIDSISVITLLVVILIVGTSRDS